MQYVILFLTQKLNKILLTQLQKLI